MLGSTNLVATDTDAKLAVFNDSATPKIKNCLAARAACSPPTLGRSLTPYLSRYGSPHCAHSLIQRLGGDPSAAQLLDPNQTGTVDNDMLDSAIADAEGDVSAAYGARFLAISSMETPPAKNRSHHGPASRRTTPGDADLAT